MSKNYDMTITPKLYTGENILVMNEYRHAFKNAFLIVDSSYTKGYKKTTNTKLPGSRSHFFSKLFYDFAKDEDYTSALQVIFSMFPTIHTLKSMISTQSLLKLIRTF
jgi:lipopolysaccharide assembly outer membrane protein LptD (OstA)